jgi:hypothetical protein
LLLALPSVTSEPAEMVTPLRMAPNVSMLAPAPVVFNDPPETAVLFSAT